MSIKKRKDSGNWMIHVVAQTPDGERIEVRKTLPQGTNQREAQAFHDRVRSEIMEGRYGKKKRQGKAAPAVPLLRDFVQEFMSGYVDGNNKPSTKYAKEHIIRNHLVPAFGHLRIDRIGTREIDVFRGQKTRDGMSGKTLNNVLSVLRRMLAVAVEWKVLDTLPVVRKAKAELPPVKFLGFEDAERLVAAVDGSWRPMVVFAMRTGLRIGELLALRWEDVDLGRRTVTVRRSVWREHEGTTKSGRSRVIPLNSEAAAALGQLGQRRRTGLVFCRPDGGALTPDRCHTPLWKACDDAGLPRIGWHALRHTFASHLTMRGAPVTAVKDLMGHSTIEMTMRYAHLTPDIKADAVALLDAPRGPKQSHSTGTALRVVA